MINLGNLTLQNISVANLTSVAGDVQGYGTVDVAGALTITADAIYPVHRQDIQSRQRTTPTPMNGVVQPGTVTFEPYSATPARPIPLSAGGTLSVYASMHQSERCALRAAFGNGESWGWDGAGTAPAPDRITAEVSLCHLRRPWLWARAA